MPPVNDDITTIRTMLDAQATAWNQGDLDTFMQPYWNDPRLRYAGGDHVVHGWERILANYRARYRDRCDMGSTHFSGVEVELLSPDAAVVFGHFAIERAGNRPRGSYTLILKKLPGLGWRIVSDHTAMAH